MTFQWRDGQIGVKDTVETQLNFGEFDDRPCLRVLQGERAVLDTYAGTIMTVQERLQLPECHRPIACQK